MALNKTTDGRVMKPWPIKQVLKNLSCIIGCSFMLCFLIQCQSVKKIKTYPSIYIGERHGREIPLTSAKVSCKAIKEQLNEPYHQGILSYFELAINGQSHRVYVTPYDFMFKGRKRNVLRLSTDSVLKGSPHHSISFLKSELKKQYDNFGRDPTYAVDPSDVFVEICFDDQQNVEDIRKLLTRLLNAYQELKNELSYHIDLRVVYMLFGDELKPPPPPELLCGPYLQLDTNTLAPWIHKRVRLPLSEILDSVEITHNKKDFEGYLFESSGQNPDGSLKAWLTYKGVKHSLLFTSRDKHFVESRSTKICLQNPSILLSKKYEMSSSNILDSSYKAMYLDQSPELWEKYIGPKVYENRPMAQPGK